MATKFSVKTSLWISYVRLVLTYLVTRFAKSGFSVGTYPGHHPTESRAADFMVPSYKTTAGIALGNALANFLTKNAVTLGVWYVIWRKKIWSRTYPNAGWRTYTNPNPKLRGTDSGDHWNHVHVSFYATTPMAALLKFIKAVVTPAKPDPAGDFPVPPDKVVYLDLLKPGQEDSRSVYWIQRALREAGFTQAKKTGNYDDDTIAAVKAFQTAMKNDPKYIDGVLGPKDTAALLKKGKTRGIRIEASSK